MPYSLKKMYNHQIILNKISLKKLDTDDEGRKSPLEEQFINKEVIHVSIHTIVR